MTYPHNMPASGTDNAAYQPETDGHQNNSLYYMAICPPSQTPPKLVDSVESKEHELQHASHMSTDSDSSRVNITDIDGEESMNLTTTHLKHCKRQVLRPYWRCLVFIGWRGFGREYVNRDSKGWRFLNIAYPVFVILMLFYTYVYEIIACQWKLNVNKDTQIVTTPTTTHAPTTQLPNITTASFIPIFPLGTATTDIVASNLTDSQHTYPPACEHIITTYVVPNILHFIAFLMGLRHFRIQENEQLYALMERVFLQATPSYSRSASQQKLTRNMRGFLMTGALWVFLTLCMQALYEWAFDFPSLAFFKTTGPLLHWFLFGIEMFGTLLANSILVAVVTNYFTQCEMILFYVKGVTLRLQEKSTDLKTAMKDILSVRQNLSILNGPIAKMTALVSVIFAELAIIGISILVLNKKNSYKVWMYRGLFPVIWITMLAIPLMQAARVNSVCNRFQKIALEIRVFGYKGSSLLELDSFLNFVAHARLRAKMFHIPILSSYIIVGVVLLLFIILILLQTSVIGSDHFF